MQTFTKPDFGRLRHADGDEVVFYQKSIRRGAPNTEFDIRELSELPRGLGDHECCRTDGSGDSAE